MDLLIRQDNTSICNNQSAACSVVYDMCMVMQ